MSGLSEARECEMASSAEFLMLAQLAAQAPKVPNWFDEEERKDFSVAEPVATSPDTQTALEAYRDMVHGYGSGQWARIERDAPALAKAAKQIIEDQQRWRERRDYFNNKETYRIELLWRVKWASDLLKTAVRVG